ncbi:MAG TPA: acetate--CoA ligase family protein [Steroidobacteraceae bacterium]|jgi:acyl-CoA synthetase (NDP forming)|nr:acetate--CoA ligase family protein [Steroidobacteraceae bacterium]
MAHRLDPLLRPRSIAVLGATEREATVGRHTIENLLKGGYEGALYAVNPGRRSVLGVPCYPTLATLPEPVEHVIFAVADTRVEAALDDVIAHGARAATIMSSLVIDGDGNPPLRERMLAKIRKSGLPVCGANGMGFYNFAEGIWGCGFRTRNHRRGGNVAYISHSGSGMCGIVDSEERIDFNLVVSTGQELAVSMDEYLDFALEMPGTRAVGLFMETARHPEGLVRAFAKARERGIPVVALKVGRTELSAKLTVSHSGAIAGQDAVYDAVFDRYGVHRARDMDELATTLILFAQPHRVAAGGLVSIHDSGGERQLLIDLAEDAGVPLPALSRESTAELESLLDPGLPAVNPLDAWSTGGPEYHVTMGKSFAVLMSDPQAALGAVVHDRAPGGGIFKDYLEYLRTGHRASGKPAILVSNRQGSGGDPLIVAATREGFPVLDGLESFLRGVRHVFDHRDFAARPAGSAPRIPDALLARMRARLADRRRFDEKDALTLLGDAGLPANAGRIVESEAGAVEAARETGFPVVLKTAKRGLGHKSDQQGVHLGLRDNAAVAAAYRDLAKRIDSRVLVAPMVESHGVEMLLGMVLDPQFGPVVLIGAGGVHVEALADAVHALPPFDADEAARLVDRLRIAPLLRSRRHRRPLAVEEFCRVAARFSALAATLGDHIAEIDLNPVIVHADGCAIVDALLVPRPAHNVDTEPKRQAR